MPGHKFTGYYFNYPGEEGKRGLVSTISEDPPMLNWIFVSAETRAVRFGSRKDSVGHVVGSWGWTADEKLLTLDGDPGGFLAVREEKVEGIRGRRWCVYWDPDGALREQMGDEDCFDVALRRRLLLGMESRYLKNSERS